MGVIGEPSVTDNNLNRVTIRKNGWVKGNNTTQIG